MGMDQEIIRKLFLSTIVLFSSILIFQIFKFYAKRTQKRMKLQISRYYALKRIFLLLVIAGFILSYYLIWGIDIEKAWISITGIVAMIAVAFFAVWSLIGNILAGVILFFTNPFKTNDVIEIMPDEIRGKVLAINFFYTMIRDEDGNFINIPNSLFFQRYIKNIKSMNTMKKEKTL